MSHEDRTAGEMRQAKDGVPDFVFADSWNGLGLIFCDTRLMILDYGVDLDNVHDTGADRSDEQHEEDGREDL